MLIIRALERLARGEGKRKVMIFLPPGSAKSTYGSVLFPPWFLAQFPHVSILAASHSMDLAERWGRRVRNLIEDQTRLLGVNTSLDNRSAGRWQLAPRPWMNDRPLDMGEYLAAGAGSAIAGYRGDLGLMDDLISGREEAMSEDQRNKLWEWYVFDFRPRLKPGARQVLIMCMTGNTRVRMADGSERALRDIRPGDGVATLDEGELSTSIVLNHVNQGSDTIYEIRTKSGKSVRANVRHPFLAKRGERLLWLRLAELQTSDELVSLAEPMLASSAAPKGAANLQSAAGCAQAIIANTDGPPGSDRPRTTLSRTERRGCDIATELSRTSSPPCSPSKTGDAPCADSLPAQTCERTGAGNFASITATTPEKLEGCSATTVTSSSATEEPASVYVSPLNTSTFTLDRIESIKLAGHEDVFDVQIERTENFIADGFVSHNTRWHEDDIAGRILAEEGYEWEVIRVPMVSESLDDPLGRPIGDMLWPEWFTEKMVEDAKRNPAAWLSLYQQRPTVEDGTYWKREWFHPVPPKHVPPRHTLRIYGASDYAVTADRGDYTAHVVIGLDTSDRPWLLDLWRERTTSDVWIDAWCELVNFYRPMTWAEEKGQIISGVGPFLERASRKKRAFTERVQFVSRLDKGVRAQSMRSHIATHGLWYANDLPGADDLLAELLSFPAGKHDDQHDAIGLVGQLLDKALAGRKPKQPTKAQRTGYKSTASTIAKAEAWKVR